MQRILVVDDEPSIGKALTLGLSSEEMEVDVLRMGTAVSALDPGNTTTG